MFIYFITSLIFSYLIGAIPTGYWVCKLFYGTDITKRGSGNIGATNVARVNGKFLFIPIFLIDAGKSYLALYFVDLGFNQFYGCCCQPWFMFLTASCLLLGNAYSVFIGFRGGKGVATMLGIIAYLFSFTFVVIFGVLWLGIYAATKQAFMASIGAMFLFLSLALLFGHLPNGQVFFLICLFMWLLFRHQSNIKRFC